MNDGLLLVARIPVGAADNPLDWLPTDEPPFEPVDPVDFLLEDIGDIYALYAEQYLRLDSRLNVAMPEALLEYDRWLLIVDPAGKTRAFICYKTTQCGLKLCLTASTDDADAKWTLKGVLRRGLNLEGVYAEVSGPLEKVVLSHVPAIGANAAELVLGKPIEPDEDGLHYTRDITNVGPKRKLMVGMPLLE